MKREIILIKGTFKEKNKSKKQEKKWAYGSDR